MGRVSVVAVAAVVMVACGSSLADVSVYDIQYDTAPDGDVSNYHGTIQNVTGAIVTHVWHGFNDRVYLQDPNHLEWGAIVVKDGEGGEFSNAVSPGDLVSFDNIFIQESRGTTFLQYRRSYSSDVAFTIEDSGLAVPEPVFLTAADLVTPLNHGMTEKYESMIVTLEGVTVGQMDLGKEPDNYELLQGSDIAWAADYMNVDLEGEDYDPRIHTGAELDSITGIVEQYTKPEDNWDYYQLLPRSASDIVPEPGTAGLMLIGLVVLVRRR